MLRGAFCRILKYIMTPMTSVIYYDKVKHLNIYSDKLKKNTFLRKNYFNYIIYILVYVDLYFQVERGFL